MSTWTFGPVSVTRIEEQLGYASFPPEQYFSGFEREVLDLNLDWLVPNHYVPAENALITSVHSWLIRTPRHTILLDCCAGNHKDRPWWPRFHQLETPFLERLRAAGARPGDIDIVLCTHLHADHIGWNTVLRDGRWVPTFPNAKYLFSRIENDFWDPRINVELAEDPARKIAYRDSVLPVVEAGQAQLVEGSHAIDDTLLVDDTFQLDDTFSLTPTPGHSPHHCCVDIRSKGHHAVVTGDMMHHALQCREPHWSTVFDTDPKQAAESRRTFLASVADTNTLVLPIHFPNPTVGLVKGMASGFDYKFVR